MGKIDKTSALLLILFCLTSLVLLTSSTVRAQQKTIVVPDNYPTISSAIGNATNGDTILVRNGNYQEHTLTINKTLTIIGEEKSSTQITNIDNHVWNQATAELPPVTYAINIIANNVKISGFTINQASVAVYTNGNDITLTGLNIPYPGEVMLNGSNQTFAYNTVSGLTSNVNCIGSGNYLIHNTIDGGEQRGIIVKGSNNVIYENKITSYNIAYINGTNTNFVANSFVIRGDSNFVGVNSLKDSSLNIHGSNNIISGNTIENGHLVIVGNSNTFFANTLRPKAITDNSLVVYGTAITNANQLPDTGMWLGNVNEDASYNTFYENNFMGNGYFSILAWSGTHGPEFFDNGKIGNYWSNYNGTDSNGDGIGDTPYLINTSDPRNNNDRTSPSNVANFVLTDNYPLISAFDTSGINIQLPSWASITVTSPPPTASFPPRTLTNSTPTPMPSPTVQEFPTNTVPDTDVIPISTIINEFIFVVVIILALVVSLLLYKRHRKPLKCASILLTVGYIHFSLFSFVKKVLLTLDKNV